MISMSVACRLGVVADVGQTLNSSTTYQHLVASNPDAVLFIGDLAYADDYVSGLILSCAFSYTPISQRDKLSCFCLEFVNNAAQISDSMHMLKNPLSGVLYQSPIVSFAV